jgi:preprotein translocase subunit SecY
LEKILNRYIWPLTIVGGATVGLLAALADLTGALSRGTGILLTVMIIYKLYEEIAKQHMMDMNPTLRKFME